MTWLQDKPESAGLGALVELSRRQPVACDRARLEAGLASLTTRIDVMRSRRKLLRRVAPVLLAAGLAVTFVVERTWYGGEPSALNYALQGGTVLEGGYLREVDGTGIHLTFEEGTRFALASGARARLRSVNPAGARLELESGAASFDVTPNAEHRWEMEVGPFLVVVKGTAFDVAWDPHAEQFALSLKHGRVSVSGPLSGGELTLLAGQHLSVDLARRETKITEGQAAPVVSAGSLASTHHTAQLSTSAVSEASITIPAAAPSVVATNKRDWVTAMARGQWDKILAQAEQAGIPNIHATASAEDLFTLANAARYRQRTELARTSLLALQRRFGQSARAVDALFLLGRMDESNGDTTGARIWYDKYLARAPNGAYAAEALGRQMTLQARSFGATTARHLAERYLQRYPNGTYARAAQVLLEAH
jgi:ferric-dicitrate binding protein FerR (iron transport regulator)